MSRIQTQAATELTSFDRERRLSDGSLSRGGNGQTSVRESEASLDACFERGTTREPLDVSWRRDVDVAGVPVAAHDVPELIRRLRERGDPYVAGKVERALGTRTVRVVFSEVEREAILRAVDDRPREFAELYAVLFHEIERRRKTSG